MKEQTYKLSKYNSFDLIHIFECGQCFRWNKEDDESFTGVFGNNVINVSKKRRRYCFQRNM